MNTFLSGPMRKIANMGRMGDTQLAHVTPEEKRLLKAMGGSGTMNPRTGMPEYFSVSGSLAGFGKSIANTLGLNTGDSDDIQTGFDTVTENVGDVAQEGAENTIEENIAGGGTISTSEQMKALLFNLANRGFLQDDYSKFTGTRFAGFDPMQMKAFGAINQFVDKDGNVITPSQFTDAASAAGAIAGTGGSTGFRSTYNPATSTSQFRTAGKTERPFRRNWMPE